MDELAASSDKKWRKALSERIKTFADRMPLPPLSFMHVTMGDSPSTSERVIRAEVCSPGALTELEKVEVRNLLGHAMDLVAADGDQKTFQVELYYTTAKMSAGAAGGR